MSSWNTISVGELIDNGEASLQTGPFGTQFKASEYVESGIPMVNVKNIGYGNIRSQGLDYLNEKTANRLHAHRLKAGDIVFGRKGSADRHVLIGTVAEGWIQGSDCMRLRLNSNRVNPDFLSYYFCTAGHKYWMEAVCAFGATMSTLNQGIVRRIALRVPNTKVQRKIAGVLSAYDELIENNKRRLALLDKLAEEVYREWFVRLRFPGHEKVKVIKGVPAGWSLNRFHEIVEYYIGGGWGEDTQSTSFSDGAYVIRGTDIPDVQAGEFDGCPFRYHKPSNLKSRLLRPNDFVFEVSGGSKDQLLGRNVLVTERVLNFFNKAVIAASFCKQIRFNSELVSPYFMKYFMKLYYDYDLVGIYQVQSTGISNYQFESFLKFQTIILPSDELQNQFDDTVKPLIDMRDEVALANIVLRKTRDVLLPRLISGKLSVENLDIQFPPSMTAEMNAESLTIANA
jgi:type I restriction enzyme, S subunit